MGAGQISLRDRSATGTGLTRRKQWSFVGVIGIIVKYILLIGLALSFMLPFIWMFSSALKDDTQVFNVPPIWVPSPTYWENFWNAWTTLYLNLWLYNNVFRYAVPVTIGTVLSSAIVAYGFSRIQWRMRDYLFGVCLATMMVPGQVTLVPLFIVFKTLGWVDSFRPLVIPAYFANAFSVFMLRQFFLTLPLELSDAARIDGANELGILLRIVMPLAKPALTVIALFSFMGAWNDYFGPLIYLNSQSQWTLARGLERLRGSVYEVGYTRMAYPYLMAVSTMITVPILIAFFLAQRTFIEGISLTGIKG